MVKCKKLHNIDSWNPIKHLKIYQGPHGIVFHITLASLSGIIGKIFSNFNFNFNLKILKM
jgi:hypothetical protein